jgi:H+/Cl- antiporter ClcA
MSSAFTTLYSVQLVIITILTELTAMLNISLQLLILVVIQSETIEHVSDYATPSYKT